ncbi:YbgC/YbaW family acyl-CoA thioester hydrolase [Propionibacterium sp. oral taxon 192 str. F0372]|uniref:acyl-CoA thioesterase n=1 Tax=Propionibacterium sp. oral taxon 192 TaxID=671222 RepID=UPI0003534201|nr:thioesterase family protein [Propionibacterium sp. oral taxon 192]EPH07045.1 YbgC/YbaW family acyl-CoA thioester hydrolase [Propionibacterium sp. oral taxon 192 str. F0372]
MRFTARVQQRWADMDVQGHVNNVVIADYLQQARSQFMEAGGATTSQMLADGVVVVHHRIIHRRALDYRGEVEIELWVAQLGGARIRIDYRIMQDSQEAVLASTVVCPFDFDAQVPRRLLAAERDWFEMHRDAKLGIRCLDRVELRGRGLPYLVEPRWSDADRYGHVNNVRTLDYVMQARIVTTTEIDPSMARMGTGDGDELRWLIARQDIDYMAQLSVRPEPYLVLTAPIRVGTSSVVLGTEIIDRASGAILVTARAVLVCAETDGVKRALPDSARQSLSELLVGD